MMYHIKILNNISDIIYQHLHKTNYQISADFENSEGILVRSANMHTMALPTSLLAIARAGVGVNNIPIEKCTDQGIVVFNTPGANANAVKELVLCALLLSGRKVMDAIQWASSLVGSEKIEEQTEKGKNKFIGSELQGKTLGVVGLGAIGVMVANQAYHGLGMNVVGYDPYISVDAAWKLSRAVSLTQNINHVLAQSDYITMHTPSTEQTKRMIKSSAIELMKDGAVVLNFARGNLVNDRDVLQALEIGKLKYYITDFPNERILGKKGIIAIPHLGASTPESEENCADMAAKQLKNYLEYGNVENSVNFPTCEMSLNSATVARLAIINKNVTNMVGQITKVLAGDGMNIENMLNKSRGIYAYTLIDVSKPLATATIEIIKGIEGIIRCRVIEF
ncbi:MAG: 3-phosphoglycerate dehydrogenase family protein [Chitinophagaceae bacterium]